MRPPGPLSARRNAAADDDDDSVGSDRSAQNGGGLSEDDDDGSGGGGFIDLSGYLNVDVDEGASSTNPSGAKAPDVEQTAFPWVQEEPFREMPNNTSPNTRLRRSPTNVMNLGSLPSVEELARNIQINAATKRRSPNGGWQGQSPNGGWQGQSPNGGWQGRIEVNRKETFPCHQCNGMNFVSKLSLSRHIQDRHTGASGFKCAICGKTSISRHALSTHMSIVHRGKSMRDFPPIRIPAAAAAATASPAPFDPVSAAQKQANQMFGNYEVAQAPSWSSDQKSRMSGAGGGGGGGFMSSQLQQKATFMRPNMMSRGGGAAAGYAATNRGGGAAVGYAATNRAGFSCTFCHQRFPIEIALRKHINGAHAAAAAVAARARQMGMFQQQQQRPLQLQQQQQQQHPRFDPKVNAYGQYDCPKCKKAFTMINTLRTHVARSHDGRKDFFCPMCKKGFSHQRNLNGHNKMYHATQIRPVLESSTCSNYKCLECGKTFIHETRLSKHIQNDHQGSDLRVRELMNNTGTSGSVIAWQPTPVEVSIDEDDAISPIVISGVRSIEQLEDRPTSANIIKCILEGIIRKSMPKSAEELMEESLIIQEIIDQILVGVVPGGRSKSTESEENEPSDVSNEETANGENENEETENEETTDMTSNVDEAPDFLQGVQINHVSICDTTNSIWDDIENNDDIDQLSEENSQESEEELEIDQDDDPVNIGGEDDTENELSNEENGTDNEDFTKSSTGVDSGESMLGNIIKQIAQESFYLYNPIF